jgi:flagellar secretion chaperone FliS
VHEYAKLYKANSITTASPGQVVLMLFDAALNNLESARLALNLPPANFKRIEVCHNHILKARTIILELNGALSYDYNPELADQLDRLYKYFVNRLFEADMKKDVTIISEVEKLLSEIRNAWAEMLKNISTEVSTDVLNTSKV